MADVERMQQRRAECKERTGNGNGFGLTLGQATTLWLSGWATPTSVDAAGRTHTYSSGNHDKRALCLPGQVLLTSPAPMASRGVLNPAHSRWLMGFPSEWDRCSPHFDHWEKVQSKLREVTASAA